MPVGPRLSPAAARLIAIRNAREQADRENEARKKLEK